MQWEVWQSRFAGVFLEGISLIKRKYLLSILLGCLLVFGLLMQAGCDESAEQELTEIRFWHNYTDDQQAVFQMLTDTYNSTEGKDRGIRVILIYKTPDEIEAELTAAFAVGEEYDYPEISIVTSELAYQAMCRSLIVNAEEYLSGAELSGYFKDFLNEGRFTGKAETYIFPISKTSDITIVNDSMWRYFYDDNNVEIQQWLTGMESRSWRSNIMNGPEARRCSPWNPFRTIFLRILLSSSPQSYRRRIMKLKSIQIEIRFAKSGIFITAALSGDIFCKRTISVRRLQTAISWDTRGFRGTARIFRSSSATTRAG